MENAENPPKPMSAEAMRFALYNRFLKGEAKIPQMPEAYLRVRRLLADPKASLEQLAQTIKADPPLAAYLMQFADSPLLRGTRPGAPLRDVLARLGIRRLGSLVTGFAIRNLYIGKESALQQVFRARWRAALERAAYSAALAQRCERVEIDEALLGGLLQDVGSLPLLAELERWPQQSREQDSLNQLCEWLSGDIGVVIMTVWKLPTNLIECARQRTCWSRETTGEIDLADLVQIAHHLRNPQLADDALAKLPAFARLRSLCPALPTSMERLREELAGDFQGWRQLLGNR
ncbi:putative signal transduction protein [Pseudomonas knackmussii B13]|uniref:Putative signal transduction protein n=1 Tax=Pseudomonas knackmussii (strain DSM 6978 / CCUG 54928 / LMG 23759 / B13) TaxID=1301098 RepID=A0A024HLL2_PSEKB|nr:HDOD domain-containing protein [Pseudomonas knackmussii]CDF85509.1 putative signal transduction protein [Pseudomonas knackmussii B13]